jgi:putative hydrolase of the HAD superfamily
MNPTDPFSKYRVPLSPIPTGLEAGGKLPDPVSGVMFDIYGTLFISGSGDIGTVRKRLRNSNRLDALISEYGITATPETLLTAYFSAIEKTHERLKQSGIDYPEVEIDRIWQEVLNIDGIDTIRRFATEFELIVNPVYPMPHLAELLTGCREKKLAMGIVSNAQFFTADLFQWFLGKDPEMLGFDPELLIYSFRHGCAKPSPRLFDAAVQALGRKGIDPAQVLYLGNDMRNDVWAAGRAGFRTALFAGDTRSLRLRKDMTECRDIAPDLLITDLNQLIGYL